MLRIRKVKEIGISIELSKITNVTEGLGGYSIHFGDKVVEFPEQIGRAIFAAWNRSMWVDPGDFDNMLNNLPDNLEEVVSDLKAEGPYLMDGLIYEHADGGLRVTRAVERPVSRSCNQTESGRDSS